MDRVRDCERGGADGEARRGRIFEKSATEEQRSQTPRPAARPPEIFSKHALLSFSPWERFAFVVFVVSSWCIAYCVLKGGLVSDQKNLRFLRFLRYFFPAHIPLLSSNVPGKGLSSGLENDEKNGLDIVMDCE
jgi:hypothetical protein